MTKNEIIGRLREAGINASSTDRSAAVYVEDAVGIRATAGWFGFRISCDSADTERRVRTVLERYYNVEISGGVWRLQSKRRLSVMAFGGGMPPTPPTPTADYLYFEAVQDNSTVSMISTLATAPNLEYSTDGATWQEWQHTTTTEDEMTIHTFDTLTLTAVGDRVYLRGINPNGFLDFENEGLSLFSMLGKITAHGNVQSLVDGDTPTLVAKSMPWFSDFMMTQQPNDVLVSAPSLPATTLAEGCYNSMFAGCAGLVSAPPLPATILAEGCYDDMFCGCTALVQAPSLPATTLAVSCYSGMFASCTALVQAPSLPATTLERECYAGMFASCTALVQAPSLPATTLVYDCYFHMFDGCVFAMSSDGTTFNFEFGVTPPVTVALTTYNTYYELAGWMGNTSGFTTP